MLMKNMFIPLISNNPDIRQPDYSKERMSTTR